MTLDQFLERSKQRHGDKYDYSRVSFATEMDKVTIICPVHGEFLSSARNHARGNGGCKVCNDARSGSAKRSSTAEFVQKAVDKYGQTYDYSLVDYKTAQCKVTVVCKTHGPFSVKANNHLCGRGCPGCKKSGFRPSKPGTLYVLRLGDITKVGITNRTVSERVGEISRSFGDSFQIVFERRFDDGHKTLSLEATLLTELRSKYEQPDKTFDGSTECFRCVDLGQLLSKIEVLTT